ncbi:MAG: tRNA (N6-isopentenyl adenosine(37)-C2)-methylthiotransferase MiaB [Leptospiraceae bacterium]|nr:tRNA (N6-isopentenyl adenosine(37)-C2)-methylthiotransferase MiaB [Leptospiraceae bacterium]MDW7976904.1 tRNA (N6-isopentenyl adenosine(37)-C2)-methylthiotransferase MiaB [Leptospiraceae bacterium]
MDKVFIETYGCQMNVYDSGIVRTFFLKKNFEVANSEDQADVIVINTCAVRENAQERVYGKLQSLYSIKKRNPSIIIAIIGCMAQNLGDDLFAMGLPIDIVLGPDNYRNLPEIVEQIRTKKEHKFQLTKLSSNEVYDDIEPEVIEGCSAFVTIMRGCDNFCSFCVVPYTRGRERSRNPKSIIKEIQNLIERHQIKEVTLLGQNVNSYRYEGYDFTDLVQMILDQTSIQRIRFTSPHPKDFPKKLIKLMSQEPRFCNSIHLPLQSGSTRILQRMHRNYTREEYLELVHQIRSEIPEVGLSTDIIVGFSDETLEDFEETLEVVKTVQFDMAYMFYYSEREHTIAKRKYKDNIPYEEKIRRLNLLIELQNSISKEKNQREIGKVYEILIEGKSRKSQKDWMGRTTSGKVVVFPDPNELYQVGDFVKVEITNATKATLIGKVI